MDGQWYRGTWDAGNDISPDQTEFATSLRVPFLTTPFPTQRYVSGIIVDEQLWRGIVPTDEEVETVSSILSSYLDYFFPAPNPYCDEMQQFAPYDIDNGAVPFYFIKYPDGTWAYRRHSWTGTHLFMPAQSEGPMTLDEVIDHGRLRWAPRIPAR